ncbi:MAG TPA: polysaccharide deacetylase family protein [Polyangiaceae bacterium]
MPLSRCLLWTLSASSLWYCGTHFRDPHGSTWLACSLFFALFACATVGALWPQLGMYGNALWYASGAGSAAALTFDDGPNPETTPQILRTLAEHDAHATFFVLGHKVERHPELARRIHDAGHELAVHGFDHDRLFSLRTANYVESQIDRTLRAISQACGAKARYFRPPIGFASHATFRGVERAGLQLVAWTTRALDGLAKARPAQVEERVVARLQAGAIIMLHDAAERDDFVPASLGALPGILEAARKRKLKLVRLDELCATAASR